jgi:hypothetical protein
MLRGALHRLFGRRSTKAAASVSQGANEKRKDMRADMVDANTVTIQLHDQFDRAFGVKVSDCCDYLDWPGKTAPFSQAYIESQRSDPTRPPADWEFMNRFRGQVKFGLFKKELISANPELERLTDTKVIFLMRSAGDARLLRELEGGVIVADALWLSYSSFCAHSLLATFPQPSEANAEQERLSVAIHFAYRAQLYQDILRNEVVDREKYQVIWDTWPTRNDGEPGALIFLWTALGRFIIAHELAHMLHHAPIDCSVDRARQRKIVPETWLEPLDDSYAKIDDYLYEVEADMEAVRICTKFFLDNLGVLWLFFAGLYYMFLCLEELSSRVGKNAVFRERRQYMRKYMELQPLMGPTAADEVEQQFRYRAKFYFDLAEEIHRPSVR